MESADLRDGDDFALFRLLDGAAGRRVPGEGSVRSHGGAEGTEQAANDVEHAGAPRQRVVSTRADPFAPLETDRLSMFPRRALPATLSACSFRLPDLTRTGLSGWHAPCALGRL
jgi:hypothetical protein